MDDVVTPRGVRIPGAAISVRFSRSGGPGGQHANTADTKARVTVDLSACGLSPTRLARLVDALGPTISATSERTRSQWRNRNVALDRILDRIDTAMVPARPRRATKPTKASQARRLADKQHTAKRKAARRRPELD